MWFLWAHDYEKGDLAFVCLNKKKKSAESFSLVFSPHFPSLCALIKVFKDAKNGKTPLPPATWERDMWIADKQYDCLGHKSRTETLDTI